MNSNSDQSTDAQPVDSARDFLSQLTYEENLRKAQHAESIRFNFGASQSEITRHIGTSSAGDHYGPTKELMSGQRQSDMQQALRSYLTKGYSLNDIVTEVHLSKNGHNDARSTPRCLALALSSACPDYPDFYQFLVAEREYLFSVKNEIQQIHEYKPVDVLSLYKAAGLKDTTDFCILFNIKIEELAGAIALADDLEAAQLLTHELWEAKWMPDHLTNAISRLPFNPLSRIGGWRYPDGQMPNSELMLRYANQTGMFRDPEEFAMFSSEPLPFGPGVRLQMRPIAGVDHGLRVLPGLHDFLSKNKDECANLLFSRIKSNNQALSPELFKLATEMTIGLVKAGMDNGELLFTHTLERSPAWFAEYERGSFNHLPRVSRCEALVDSLIKVNKTRHNTPTTYDIFKILLSLESVENLIGACDTDEKRRSVHDIVPDHRLVECMAPNAREDLLQSDLGL
jgi:hypothetical protein